MISALHTNYLANGPTPGSDCGRVTKISVPIQQKLDQMTAHNTAPEFDDTFSPTDWSPPSYDNVMYLNVSQSVWDESLTLADMLDRMVLDINFDYSCLDNLDEQLLSNPMDSFADLCWRAAVYDDNISSLPTPPRRRRTFASIMEAPSEEDDSDDSLTYQGSPTSSTYGKGEISVIITDPPMVHEQLPKYTNINDGGDSFIFLDPQFSVTDPSKSIGYFPIPLDGRQNTQGKHSSRGGIDRIAALCGKLIRSPS